MKKLLKNYMDLPTIHITMYLRPEIYISSKVVTNSVQWDKIQEKYFTNVNTPRRINGPLSDYGQELESPIREEYGEFVDDCIWLIKEYGFIIVHSECSTDSKKSECIIVFGVDEDPCGTLIFELRITDNPLDAKFPKELKSEVLNYLKMDKVLDNTASDNGINFRVDKVTMDTVTKDDWGDAFDRLGDKLDNMRRTLEKENR